MKVLGTALLLIICFYPLNTFGGCIKGDCMNGQGTFIYSNGEKYVGQFKGGGFHGKGTLTSPDGEKYVGEFKDNMLNGEGILVRRQVCGTIQR
jgi:hypothetical protein